MEWAEGKNSPEPMVNGRMCFSVQNAAQFAAAQQAPGGQFGPPAQRPPFSAPGGGIVAQPNCVIMVYGLNPTKMNCDLVFNMFCLFGNVLKVCASNGAG